MKLKNISLAFLIALFAANAGAWEASVTEIMQHGTYVAISLSPDPGPGSCQYGSPYLLVVDNTPESKQRFAIVLTAIASGKKLAGYDDGCSSAIWGQSRPTVQRLVLKGN